MKNKITLDQQINKIKTKRNKIQKTLNFFIKAKKLFQSENLISFNDKIMVSDKTNLSLFPVNLIKFKNSPNSINYGSGYTFYFYHKPENENFEILLFKLILGNEYGVRSEIKCFCNPTDIVFSEESENYFIKKINDYYNEIDDDFDIDYFEYCVDNPMDDGKIYVNIANKFFLSGPGISVISKEQFDKFNTYLIFR